LTATRCSPALYLNKKSSYPSHLSLTLSLSDLTISFPFLPTCQWHLPIRMAKALFLFRQSDPSYLYHLCTLVMAFVAEL